MLVSAGNNRAKRRGKARGEGQERERAAAKKASGQAGYQSAMGGGHFPYVF